MNSVVISPVLKNKPWKLSQGVFRVKLKFYQLNEFYCCSTGKINPVVFYW